MLNAELADNDGWQMLISLASGLGHSEFEEQFAEALEEEEEHLENVRHWLSSMILSEANAADASLDEDEDEEGDEEEEVNTRRTKKSAKQASQSRSSGKKRKKRNQT
jgi:hypothetical protein